MIQERTEGHCIMGGPGSGRWHGHTKADAVEDCLTLDLGQLAGEGAFTPWHTGALRWLRGERETASIRYAVRPAGDGLVFVLSYRCTPPGGAAGEDVEMAVGLEALPLPFGGVRWWGQCPLVISGRPCGRRVLKLYLPPGARYFGCRRCYGLTYRSVQEHDKRVDFLRSNPESLAAIVNNPGAAFDRQLILALKALR
jgi:hypothetical protein